MANPAGDADRRNSNRNGDRTADRTANQIAVNDDRQQQQQQQQQQSNNKNGLKIKDKFLWRDLTAYWILGLCNNYGYVVMLSAAHDIIERFGTNESQLPDNGPDDDDPAIDLTIRKCNIVSTGAILLADILPSLIVKVLSPFLPFFINIRILSACLLQIGGFLLVAFAETEWIAILGVVFTSLSSGLGETSFLAYSSFFNKNVISTWSSGTGGAGIIGSLSYAGLIQLGVSSVNTMLIMLIVPLLEAISFWLILRRPQKMIGSNELAEPSDTKIPSDIENEKQPPPPPPPPIDNLTISAIQFDHNQSNINIISVTNGDGDVDVDVDVDVDDDRRNVRRGMAEAEADGDDQKPLIGIAAKFLYIPSLFKYMIPLTLVYLFEYFINQGLFELVFFPNIWLTQQEQYRWLQVDYQIGVFISRSSVNLFAIDKLWMLAVLQFLNVIYFMFEIIYFFSPSIWLIFAVVFWEGLLGGGAYVNTFYKMSKEIPSSRKKFALGVVTLSDSVGIALAGIAAIPTHNALCGLPQPLR